MLISGPGGLERRHTRDIEGAQGNLAEVEEGMARSDPAPGIVDVQRLHPDLQMGSLGAGANGVNGFGYLLFSVVD